VREAAALIGGLVCAGEQQSNWSCGQIKQDLRHAVPVPPSQSHGHLLWGVSCRRGADRRWRGYAMLDASRLHVTFAEGARPDDPLGLRRYTLTHSDLTGDLFLTIGPDYDRQALRALQARLERDEVLGEWAFGADGPRLDLHMTAQGGLPVFGTGAMRCNIFRRYRPTVLEALGYGDRVFAEAHPELDDALVVARFHWRRGRVESEPWGRWGKAPSETA
jgi:hypothetical protein